MLIFWQTDLKKLPALIFFAFIGLSLTARSDALEKWQWRNPLPQGNPLYGVEYGNGKFVAVGALGPFYCPRMV
jgi:hypothetical protein